MVQGAIPIGRSVLSIESPAGSQLLILSRSEASSLTLECHITKYFRTKP